MSILKAKLEILEWVIRLTYTGMPLGMVRRFLILKKEELEAELTGKKT